MPGWVLSIDERSQIQALDRAQPGLPLKPGKCGTMTHVIADNYATHKHPKVCTWLERHPRWVFHFTPTSSSWINAVEGFFSALSRRRLRRGVFRSVADLEQAIACYIRQHNVTSGPFVWTKPAERILAKLARLPASPE